MKRIILQVGVMVILNSYMITSFAQIQNTKYGTGALGTNFSGSYNAAIGYHSLNKNLTGFYNTATGHQSLYFNVGSSNSAFGRRSLYNNTNGISNTAAGLEALYSNTTGDYNSAFGISSLHNSETADYNTGIGYVSLYNNVNGHTNTATGSYSLYANISGLYNTAFGGNALSTNTTGSWNTAIGHNAGVLANNLTNTTTVGRSAKATANNQVRIGNESVMSIGGFADWTDLPSDSRFKKNVKENVPGLDFINQLRAVTYNVDIASINKKLRANEDTANDALIDNSKAIEVKSKEVHTGFIAQEVEALAKKINFNFNGVDAPKNEQDLYGLRYSKFVVPLVKAVQELSKKTEEENKLLREEVNTLTTRLLNIEALLLSNNNPIRSSIASNNSSAYIEQNMPNPSTGSTLIRFYIPTLSTSAKILIHDVKGSMIKSISINNKGKGQYLLNSSLLASGSYTYTLFVDGKPADTKQMIVSK